MNVFFKSGRILLTLSTLLIYNISFAQNSVRICDTIPYELVGDKMILSLTLNNRPAKFILDTGGLNVITSDMAEDYGVNIVSQETMQDANNKSVNFYQGQVSGLKLSENLIISELNIHVSPPQSYFRSLGVVGTLGGKAFSNICLTIDSRNKQIILSYPFRPEGIPRKDGIPMRMGSNSYSIFPIQIGNTSLSVLFDTGFYGFFHISKEDFVKISESEDVETTTSGAGIWHVGISGFSGLKPEQISKLLIPSIKVGGKEFENVGSLTSNATISIIGSELLNYGKVILDYPRSLFYFYPYEDNAEQMEELTRVWNVNILPVVDHFEVTGILGEVDVEAGEYVWDINGTSLEDFPLSQPEIIKLFNNIDTDTAYIWVGETRDSARKVTVRKV